MNQYIVKSKEKINNYIDNNDYQGAFNMLILVLNELDSSNINDFIKYYNERIFYLKKEEFTITIKRKL